MNTGILLISAASGIAHTALRRYPDAHELGEPFQPMPIAHHRRLR